MKKVLAWVLLLTLVLGLFVGCRNTEDPETQPPEPTAPQGDIKAAGANDAIEYLKAFYKDDGTQTPVDYNRFGIVRVGGVAFDVVWSVDVGEDLIKIVVNEDGTVTIDINEQCQEDTEYTLTATVTDANGNTASYSWTHILPKAQDMVEIVKAAYALAPGESLPYESRLIGKIISIDSIWSDEYQNISVTIEVEGAEDMPIQCYRMKSNENTVELIKDLKVGNIITVVGTLKNYEGTIEFDAGCILEKVEKGDAVEAPTDPGEILKAAYALAQDEALPYQATLTGTVTEIDTPYDPAYSNISVVIVVEGYEQYPILCYRLKGTGVDQIAVNDLITVTGIIKNYKGTIEYDSGCMMTERVSGGGVAQGPSSDAVKILADAAKLSSGEKLPYRATLTGEIVSVDNAYDPNYGNVTVTMKVNGVKIQCYRMVGDGIDQIRETDTITVSGVIENYNGKLEFGAKSTLDSWTPGPRNVNYGSVKEDVAYRLYMDQKATGNTVYFNGEVSSNRLQTTTTGSKGVDVYAERHSKGLRFYYMDGQTKTYIEIEEYTNDSGQQRGGLRVTTEPSCYWVYNSDCGVYIVNLPTAGKYFLGTYGTYETISASWIGYIDGSYSGGSTQYVAKFIEASKVQDEEPSDTVVQGTAVENPAVGTAYKFGYYQNNLDGKPFLAFNGKMAATYYFGTADAIANMVDVYLEEAEGGYHIYFMDGNTKTYLDIVPRDTDATKVNTVLQTSGAHTVWQLNLEYKYVYATEAGSEWYLGAYGDKDTIAASATSYISDTSLIGVSQFCAWFSEVEEVEAPEEPEPTEPEETEPEDSSEMVTSIEVGTAYKWGIEQETLGKTLYFAGTMDGYYGATTENIEEAVDVVLEAADGGYYVSFTDLDGAKKYVNVVVSGTYRNFTIADSAATVYTYDSENNTLLTDVNGTTCYLGTWGNYNTFSVSTIDKIGTSFPSHFYTADESSEEPEETEPDTTGSLEMVTSPEVGTAYKLYSEQGNVGKTLYFAGTTANKEYYFSTTEDASVATDVYLEAADGGYYLYFFDANGTKTYIDMVVSSTFFNLKMATEPGVVYTFNEEYNTLVASVDGTDCYIGTYGTYETLSCSNISYISTSFPSHLGVVGEGGEEPDVTEPEETEPEVTEPDTTGSLEMVTSPEAGTAYKLYSEQGNVGKTLYFAGTTANKEYYFSTTEDASVATDVYLEAADGGYYLYFFDANGTKTYIDMVVSSTFFNLKMATEPGVVYTFNEEYNTLVASVDGTDCYIGTYGTYETLSCSNISYIPTSFPSHLGVVGEGGEEPDVTEPEATEPEATEPEATEPEETIPDVEFIPVAFVSLEDNVAMTALAENPSTPYGYLPKTDVTIADGVLTGITEANVFYLVPIEVTDDTATVYILDCYGRVLYMTGTFNSFNISDEIPEEGAEWLLTNEGDGMVYITNILTNKTVGYGDSGYTTFGAYADEAKHTMLAMVPVVFEEEDPDATEPEETTPSTGSSVTYTFSNYDKGTQWAENEVHELDDIVTVTTNQCHFTTQLRVYQDATYDGNAVFASAKVIDSLVINAGYKVASLDVYGSVDGVTWTKITTVSVTSTTYADYTVDMPEGTSYKYLKLDAVGAQIRIPYITFNFAE